MSQPELPEMRLLQEQSKELRQQKEELQKQQEELQAQNEEIQAQNEELRLANESLVEAQAQIEDHVRRIEAIQYVSDAALSHLGMDDLMNELLRRVRKVLGTDTATILILDAVGKELVVRASDGLWREDGEVVHIPIGRGFAGRIAMSGQPMVVEDVSTMELVSPWMAERVRSLAGVPLVAEGRLIGVLHVGSGRRHSFREDEVRLLQMVADRVSLAIENARLLEEAEYEKEKWFTTVDSMLDPVTVGDAEGHATYMNKAYSKLIDMEIKDGLALEEHATYYQLYHPDGTVFAAEDLPLQRAALRNEDVGNVELVQRTPRGEERIAIFSGSPLHDRNGRVVGSVAIGRDITEQRRTEAALRESEDKYRTLYSAMSEGVALHRLLYDESGLAIDYIIMDVNPAYESITGLSRSAAIGVRASDLYGAGEPPYFEIYSRVAESGVPESFETYFPPMDKHFSISVFSPRPGQFATVFSDISDRKRAEQEREDLLRRTEEAVRARDEFLSIASHELKTPITSMLGFTQIALRKLERKGVLDIDEGRRPLEIIEQQSQKLAGLVSRLLDIARIESGRLVLEPVETDLTSLVERAVASVQMNTDNHALLFSPSPEVTAQVDGFRLEQVITNLLDNAVKYSPAGGDIEVELYKPDNGCVCISVRDHGVGIPSEHREHIFERFYQVEKDKRGGGMGLGLHVSSEIVKLHGGTIDVQFPEDGGTRFMVTLPLTV